MFSWLFSLLPAVVATSLAGPVRCEAVFAGPREACPVSIELSVPGEGPTRPRAEAAALDRLSRAVDSRLAVRERGEGAALVREARAACARSLPELAHIACFEDPSLVGPMVCTASLSSCATGLSSAEGPGWRARGEARDALCATVPRDCLGECLEGARMRCDQPVSSD